MGGSEGAEACTETEVTGVSRPPPRLSSNLRMSSTSTSRYFPQTRPSALPTITSTSRALPLSPSSLPFNSAVRGESQGKQKAEGGHYSQRDEASLAAWSDRIGDVCSWVHRFVMLSTPRFSLPFPRHPRGRMFELIMGG